MRASNKEYKQINELNNLLCWAKNPNLVFRPLVDGEPLPLDLGEPEIAVLVSDLEDILEMLLEQQWLSLLENPSLFGIEMPVFCEN